ncbi:MAG: ATP-grasp domain-containing protein [Gammaproteobacteria bacterium]
MKTNAKPGLSPGFVLLIAPSGSYRIHPYLAAAKSLGLDLIVVSNSEHSLVPQVAKGIAVDFDNPTLARETILHVIAGLNIVCVLATDDVCVGLCSQIAQHLNLPQNTPAAAHLTHRKDLARGALRQAGCNTPEYQVIEMADAAELSTVMNYPVVIKPLSLSASRGVIRANDTAEFVDACRRIDTILENAGQYGFQRYHVLVESYLDGPEFAVEGLIVDGTFHLLTIFDKPEPLVGPFFEETCYLTPTQLHDTSKRELIDEVSRCCQAYELTHGPVHAEARITRTGVVLLELAARTIGGQCGQLIEFSTRQKLEELVIQGMCGIEPNLPSDLEAAGVLMIPVTKSGLLKRVEGLTAALRVEFIKDIEIHINEGYELVPLPEGSSYLGFIFAQAPTYAQTYEALKTAYSNLQFVTQPVWKIDRQAG